jgi:hypothetical protein
MKCVGTIEGGPDLAENASYRSERERDLELLKMFNEAAADVTAEDHEERESLLGGFVGGPTS